MNLFDLDTLAVRGGNEGICKSTLFVITLVMLRNTKPSKEKREDLVLAALSRFSFRFKTPCKVGDWSLGITGQLIPFKQIRKTKKTEQHISENLAFPEWIGRKQSKLFVSRKNGPNSKRETTGTHAVRP